MKEESNLFLLIREGINGVRFLVKSISEVHSRASSLKLSRIIMDSPFIAISYECMRKSEISKYLIRVEPRSLASSLYYKETEFFYYKKLF